MAVVYLLIGCSKSAKPLTNAAKDEDNIDTFFDPNPGASPSPSASPSPTPDPSPTPTAGLPYCEIERLTTYTTYGQSLSFKMTVFGSFTSAQLNGKPVNPQNPFSLLPDALGAYRAFAIVSSSVGSSSCEALFVPPTCSLEVKSKTNGKAELKMTLGGGISIASINGHNQTLPVPPNNSILYTHNASGGAQTVTGHVKSAYGDSSSCSVSYNACESQRVTTVSLGSRNSPLYDPSTQGWLPGPYWGIGASAPADLAIDLKEGDKLKISNISSDAYTLGGFSSVACNVSVSGNDFNGIPVLQLATEGNAGLVPFSGTQASNQYSLSIYQISQLTSGITIPAEATRAVGSIPDSYYHDNYGNCSMKITVIPACTP